MLPSKNNPGEGAKASTQQLSVANATKNARTSDQLPNGKPPAARDPSSGWIHAVIRGNEVKPTRLGENIWRIANNKDLAVKISLSNTEISCERSASKQQTRLRDLTHAENDSMHNQIDQGMIKQSECTITFDSTNTERFSKEFEPQMGRSKSLPLLLPAAVPCLLLWWEKYPP